MNYKILIFTVLLTLCGHLSEAQILETTKPSDSANAWQLFKYDAQYTIKGVGHSLTRPLHWKGDDFGKLGILLVGTTVLSLADEPIRDLSETYEDKFPKPLRDLGWYFGNPQNYFAANAGLYAFGLITKNEKVRKTSVLIISSSITSGLIQSIGKSVIGRARPGSGFDNYTFNPFSGEATYRSFPSGHTVLAVTMAHAVAKQFDNPWIKAGIYTVGAIPPISRVIENAHWISDVAFSTVISIIVVDSIDKFLFNEDAYDYPKKKKQISWNLRFSSNQIGIVGTF